jgi:Bacterial Ig domain
MSVKYGVIVLGFLIWMPSASAASRCDVPLIRTYDNQTVSGTMYAVSGKPCSIVVNATNGAMQTAEVVQNASNGHVTASGQRITYISRAGFTGEDHFTYSRHGINNLNAPVVRTVNVTVQVTAGAK